MASPEGQVHYAMADMRPAPTNPTTGVPAVPLSEVGQPGGVAQLDSTGVVPDAQVEPSVGRIVVHGATAGIARPATATFVHWIGSVAPTNAAANDEWTDTANKVVKRWNGSSFDSLGSAASAAYPNASGAATVVDRPLLRVNVKDYGAKGDAVSRADGVTNGTTTFTSATAAFLAGRDEGKAIIVYAQGAAGADLVTTIAAVNSPTSVTLTVAAAGSASSRPFTYATDDTTAIGNALTAAGLTNAQVYFPPGRYYDTATHNFDLSTNLRITGESTWQWLNDNLQPLQPSEWLYAGAATSTQSFLSARGSAGFLMEGVSVRYVSKAFAGILLNLAGNGTRHTFTPRLSRCTFDMINDVWTAQACLDLRGMVVFDAEDCTFGGAIADTQLVTGTDTFSNAVTFTRCIFARSTYAYDTVNSACLPSQLVFRDCVFENEPFGSNPVQFRFHSGDSILFDGCGFWDGVVGSVDWITTLNTINALSVRGCYVQGGRYFINPATIKGLVVTGNRFINSGGLGGSVFGPNGTVTAVVTGGNAFDTAWTDNTRNGAGVLPEGVIARTVVGSAVASVTFSSIPQTFEKLRITFSGRGDVAAGTTQLKVQFNGDTAGNYDDQSLVGNAGSTSADETIGASSGRLAKYITGGNPAAGNWATVATEIVGYARTVGHKIAQSVSGMTLGTGTGQYVAQTATARWRSTAAITSITLLPGSGNFAAGTVITLYGDN